MFSNKSFDTRRRSKFFRFFVEIQTNFCSSCCFFAVCDRIISFSFWSSEHCVFSHGFGFQFYTFCNHKCTIKSYPKLSNQVRSYFFFLVLFYLFHSLQKRLRTWLSDSSDMRLYIFWTHSDSIIYDCKNTFILICLQRNSKISFISQIRCILSSHYFGFLDSIICIRYQFPQKYLFVGINTVCYKLDELLYISFKTLSFCCCVFALCFFGHGLVSKYINST